MKQVSEHEEWVVCYSALGEVCQRNILVRSNSARSSAVISQTVRTAILAGAGADAGAVVMLIDDWVACLLADMEVSSRRLCQHVLLF